MLSFSFIGTSLPTQSTTFNGERSIRSWKFWVRKDLELKVPGQQIKVLARWRLFAVSKMYHCTHACEFAVGMAQWFGPQIIVAEVQARSQTQTLLFISCLLLIILVALSAKTTEHGLNLYLHQFQLWPEPKHKATRHQEWWQQIFLTWANDMSLTLFYELTAGVVG